MDRNILENNVWIQHDISCWNETFLFFHKLYKHTFLGHGQNKSSMFHQEHWKVGNCVSREMLSLQVKSGLIKIYMKARCDFIYFNMYLIYQNFLCTTTLMSLFICRNDKLSLSLSWVYCLQTDLNVFILFSEISQILPKIFFIPIFLIFTYLALNLFVKNKVNSNSTLHCRR